MQQLNGSPIKELNKIMLALPLNLRRLLAHAYFSRLWNLAASERLRRHGLKRALEGELVFPTAKRFARLMRRGSGARRASVHVVTAEEAAAGTYSARQVVLPLLWLVDSSTASDWVKQPPMPAPPVVPPVPLTLVLTGQSTAPWL